jgi:hypothetical protein
MSDTISQQQKPIAKPPVTPVSRTIAQPAVEVKVKKPKRKSNSEIEIHRLQNRIDALEAVLYKISVPLTTLSNQDYVTKELQRFIQKTHSEILTLLVSGK